MGSAESISKPQITSLTLREIARVFSSGPDDWQALYKRLCPDGYAKLAKASQVDDSQSGNGHAQGTENTLQMTEATSAPGQVEHFGGSIAGRFQDADRRAPTEPDPRPNTFVDHQDKTFLIRQIHAAPRKHILFASLGGGSSARGWLCRLFIGSEHKTERPQISKVILKRLHPDVVQQQIDLGTLEEDFESRFAQNLRKITGVLRAHGVDLEVTFWDAFPPPFHGYLYDSHIFCGEWIPGSDGVWHVHTPKLYATSESDPELFARTLAQFTSQSVLPTPDDIGSDGKAKVDPFRLIRSGKLLEREDVMPLLTHLACSAQIPQTLFASVGVGDSACAWLSSVLGGARYLKRPPLISKIVLTRISPAVATVQVQGRTLSPYFDMRLNLNELEILRKAEARGIEVEVRHAADWPPQFYGWIFGDHLLKGIWARGSSGFWHTHSPMRYLSRVGDPSAYAHATKLLELPTADPSLSRVQMQSFHALATSGIHRAAVSFPDDIEWDEIIGQARTVDLVTITSLAWRKKNVLRLRSIFSDLNASVRVVLPDVGDDAVIEMIARQRVWTRTKVREYILDTEQFYKRLLVEGGANVKFYWMKVPQKYAIYRFDDAIVLKFYGHSRNDQPGPALVVRNGGPFFPHILRDLEAIFSQHVEEFASSAGRFPGETNATSSS